MTAARKSKKERVLSALSKGSLTATQMQTRFGVTNPSSLVSSLRNEGYAVYLNTRTRKNGAKSSFYRLGRPSASLLDTFAARGITPKTV